MQFFKWTNYSPGYDIFMYIPPVKGKSFFLLNFFLLNLIKNREWKEEKEFAMKWIYILDVRRETSKHYFYEGQEKMLKLCNSKTLIPVCNLNKINIFGFGISIVFLIQQFLDYFNFVVFFLHRNKVFLWVLQHQI